jgi:N-acetyl-anhydromuramyl-L-alanine amidase AmpD
MKRAGCVCRHALLVLGVAFVWASETYGQVETNLPAITESAGREVGVPPAIMQGIAFVESRWAQVRPEDIADEDRHMPAAYGIMGLRNDAWFGHSLLEAALLIGVTPETLKEGVVANVRGAAALLARSAAAQAIRPDPARLETWLHVVASYPGIPQRHLRGLYAREVFKVLAEGYEYGGILIYPQPVDSGSVNEQIEREYPTEQPFSLYSDDYGPAVWVPSPNFNSRAGTPITHVAIHVTQGGFAGALSWLTNPASQVSAHYLFRSSDGYLAQMVREADRAWHVNCWNSWTVGIEHEGWVDQPQWFTPVMYQQSALLVRHLCDRYGLAKDRLRIVGHNVWQEQVLFPQLGWQSCNTHTDPGPHWNWNYFVSLVVADSSPATALSVSPTPGQQNVPIYKKISVTFDRPMNTLATQGAFSILNPVPGSFSWSNDGKTMFFTPTGYLTPSETYIVSVGGGARSSGGGPLQNPVLFVFTTADPDSAGPAIIRSFPANGQSGVSPHAGFNIRFDEPVVFSSFAGRVRLVDLADSTVTLGFTGVSYQDIDDRGHLSFFPSQPLQFGHSYRLSFLPGLRDVFGNLTTEEYRMEFTVQQEADIEGPVIDAFEDNSAQWQQPAASSGTTGIDTALTSFTISSERKKNGLFAGKLRYEFVDTAAVCVVRALNEHPVWLLNGWVGAWVFGDNGLNQLELRFSTFEGIDHVGIIGPVDWFGWKHVTYPLANVQGTVTGLHSFALRRTPAGDRGGTVYFDDLQVQFLTGVKEDPAAVHSTFTLHQNYPNPFNPTTTIFFELGRTEHARLTVYNTLGQRVAVLVDKVLEAGRYSAEFSGLHPDGTTLPSGVYLYRLETAGGASVRKMLLMK